MAPTLMIQFAQEAYQRFVTTWLGGIDNEIQFWDSFIRDKGGQWPHTYRRRVDPAPSCQLDRYLSAFPDWPVRALDVGAGPISNVGVMTPRGRVELSACDALASVYTAILARHGIVPYVATEFALVERLTDRYAPGSFDIVNMENALDHAFDPFIGIAEMLRVARTGGLVLLIHAENEAEREHYNGFHQWNITERNGRLVIWRDRFSYVVDDVFAPFARVSASREKVGDIWMIRAELWKTDQPPRKPEPLLLAYDAILIETARARVTLQRSADAPAPETGHDGPAPPVTSPLVIPCVPDDFGAYKRLRKDYENVLTSRSWQVTRPLRAMGRWARRLTQGPGPGPPR